jgi:hypothetical protein
MADPLKPDLPLLMKLGSIVVHVDELLSAQGHDYDRQAIAVLLSNEDVRQWIKQMGVYLPVKRVCVGGGSNG